MSTVDDDWSDVWLEYRSFFHRYRLAEGEARLALTATAEIGPRILGSPPDLDPIADALKEYAIRAAERGVHADGGPLLADLHRAARLLDNPDPIARHATAIDLFGARGEDLGAESVRFLALLVAPNMPEVTT